MVALLAPAAIMTWSYVQRETYVADPAPPAPTLERTPAPLVRVLVFGDNLYPCGPELSLPGLLLRGPRPGALRARGVPSGLASSRASGPQHGDLAAGGCLRLLEARPGLGIPCLLAAIKDDEDTL